MLDRVDGLGFPINIRRSLTIKIMSQTIKRFGTKEKITFSNKGVNERALVIIDGQSHPKGVSRLLRASITIFASP